jgi:hypothetical protein
VTIANNGGKIKKADSFKKEGRGAEKGDSNSGKEVEKRDYQP